jgi:hypothetical protein
MSQDSIPASNSPNIVLYGSQQGRAVGGGWGMGVAPGACIQQQILKDPHSFAHWRTERSVLVSVQILNSVAFEMLTGMLPPPSPITVKSYLDAGYPFYSFYSEDAASSAGQRNFSRIRSIADLDVVDGKIEFGTSVAESRKVACTVCHVRLCDCM